MFTTNLLLGIMNWKTTLTGIITGGLLMAESFGYIHLAPSDKEHIIAAAIIVVSWFAKDGDKSGTPKSN